jgi:hypothetical protein
VLSEPWNVGSDRSYEYETAFGHLRDRLGSRTSRVLEAVDTMDAHRRADRPKPDGSDEWFDGDVITNVSVEPGLITVLTTSERALWLGRTCTVERVDDDAKPW